MAEPLRTREKDGRANVPRNGVDNMYLTANSQVASQKKTGKHGWAGIAKHVNRQLKHEKNITIQPEYTPLNILGTVANRQKTLNKILMPYIKERDSTYSKNSKKRYNDVSGYLKANKRLTPDKLYLATYGNRDAKEQAIDAIARKRHITNDIARTEYLKACAKGLKTYTDSFNKRHSNMTVGHYGVHVDEGGAPHVHMQVFAHGETAKGKPSLKFNEAIVAELAQDKTVGLSASELRGKKTEELMSMFREREDPNIIRVVGTEVSKTFSDVPELQSNELVRTNKTGTLDMQEYKDLKQAQEALTHAEEVKRNRLRDEADAYKSKLEYFKDASGTVASDINSQEEASTHKLIIGMYDTVQSSVNNNSFRMKSTALKTPKFASESMIYDLEHSPAVLSTKKHQDDKASAEADAEEVHGFVEDNRNNLQEALRKTQEWVMAKFRRIAKKNRDKEAELERQKDDLKYRERDFNNVITDSLQALDFRSQVEKSPNKSMSDAEWYQGALDGDTVRSKSGAKVSPSALVLSAINHASYDRLSNLKEERRKAYNARETAQKATVNNNFARSRTKSDDDELEL